MAPGGGSSAPGAGFRGTPRIAGGRRTRGGLVGSGAANQEPRDPPTSHDLPPVVKHRIVGAAAGLVALTLLSKGFGLARELVVARWFGAGPEFDAYLVGYSLPEVCSFVAFYVALYLFVPLYLEERERSPASADRFASAFFLRSSLLLLGLGGVLAWGAGSVVRLVVPDLDPGYAAVAVTSLRVLSLVLVLRGLEGGFRGLANADGRFWLPSFGALLASLVIIGSVVLAAGRFGVIALAVGVALGTAAPVLVIAFPVVRDHRGLVGKPAWSHPLIARCARRLPWIVAVEVCGLLRPLVDRAIAGRVLDEGSISALSYSGALSELPFQVLGLTIATVLLPEFARLHARSDRAGAERMLRRAIGVGVILMLPFTVLLVVLREPTVRAMYQRGHFDAAATHLTAQALWPLALGLPAMVMAGVTMQAAYASGRLRELLLIRVLALVVKVGSSLALAVGSLGVAGLALGTTLFNVTVALGLTWVLLGRIPIISRPAWVLAGTALCGLAGWGADRAFGTLVVHGGWASLGLTGAAWLGGLAVFFLVCRVGRVEELLWIQERVRAALASRRIAPDAPTLAGPPRSG